MDKSASPEEIKKAYRKVSASGCLGTALTLSYGKIEIGLETQLDSGNFNQLLHVVCVCLLYVFVCVHVCLCVYA